MNGISGKALLPLALLCAVFVLWIASIGIHRPGAFVTPGGAPAPARDEGGPPPSNEIHDFQQLG